MSAGQRGLLAFWIGGASAPPATAGTRSLLAPWIGGASAPAAAGQGGARSLLAPWIGGASAPAGSTAPGYRSFAAFWLGGAAAGPASDVTPSPDGRGGGLTPRRTVRRITVPRKRRDTDDDVLLFILKRGPL